MYEPFENKQIIQVNSALRNAGTESSFSIKIDYNPLYPCDTVAVAAVSIPKVFYVINANNCSFTLTEGSQSVQIQLPSGNPDPNTLVSLLNSQLNTASPNKLTYQVVFGKYPCKLLFLATNPGNIPIKFTFSTQMHEVMGFYPGEYAFTDNALTSVRVINLNRESTLFIHSDICANIWGDNILQQVYTVSNAANEYIYWENPNVVLYGKTMLNKSGMFTFYLTDEFNNIIDVNGCNINLTLVMWKKSTLSAEISDVIKLVGITEHMKLSS